MANSNGRAHAGAQAVARKAKPAGECAPGVVEASGIYTLAEFSRRTGLGRWAVRQARQAGLRVLRIGGRGFVRGSDFLSFLEEQAAASAEAEECLPPL